ncbi:Hypothetical protein R9X50_00640800 [Acrodontium crateriforme]|uniref:3',5'-cyclic-nucleotide phosphodiesterase n=1 Tax=Acrodontium crateriforme TaxID=150365 RepID=A0AAQ3MA10_9PEZI|nr:Hypothetical protein R9X50_00640800 [Acrodontium crateriforme]
MKDNSDEAGAQGVGFQGKKPALQVICLGNSGGPSEENATGFLVRSIGSNWSRNSLLAVDAGSHLAPIVRILQKHFPLVSGNPNNSTSSSSRSSNGNHGALNRHFARASLSPSNSGEDDTPVPPEPTLLTEGPFAGLKFPNESAGANALHVLRNYISTYLITHPHLDHLSGFTINTAAFHATSKPKTLAALPSTVDAIKTHIFNDIIWPNLSDEDGGVGFVTFQRLKEGGDVMMGESEGRGYIEICDGLGVKAFKVSHGVCTKSPPSHRHRGSVNGLEIGHGGSYGSDQAQGMSRSFSISQNQFSAPGTPGVTPRQSFYTNLPSPRMSTSDGQAPCVVDSTTYFIRDCDTAREILIFGDVEPDSISLSPRNRLVWQEAARKIAYGLLGGIFIESSYDDSQADAVLFGHLNPRHLIAELQTLASLTLEAKAQRIIEKSSKKRKHSGPHGLQSFAKHAMADSDRIRSRSAVGRTPSQTIRRSSVPEHNMVDAISPTNDLATPPDPMTDATSPRSISHAQSQSQHRPTSLGLSTLPSASTLSGFGEPPLTGIKVVIIHIKDTMKDGPHVSENILAQLQEHELGLREVGQGLGCEFVISRSGESYWF